MKIYVQRELLLKFAKGTSICRAALDSGISIEHACELSCACTTCHVYVKEGLRFSIRGY
jgi:2Fe-2S ferredoxin